MFDLFVRIVLPPRADFGIVCLESFFVRLCSFFFFFLQLVFDTAKAPFTKTSAGLIVGGGVFLGIGIVCGAVRHQQIKHGERHHALQLLKKSRLEI